MILSAGFGTRLKPFTDSLPKVLIPVKSLPLLCYPMYLLYSQGYKEILINVHYQKEKIMDFFEDGSFLGLNIKYSIEHNVLGTGGAFGQPKVKAFFNEREITLLNGDSILDVNLGDLQKSLITEAPEILMAGYGLYDKSLGTLGIHQRDHHQLSRIRTWHADQEDSSTNYAGLMLLKSGTKLLETFQEETYGDIVEDYLMPILQAGKPILVHPGIKCFLEVGNEKQWIEANHEQLHEKLSYFQAMKYDWGEIISTRMMAFSFFQDLPEFAFSS